MKAFQSFQWNGYERKHQRFKILPIVTTNYQLQPIPITTLPKG